jgi:hypothetical protein
LSSDTTSKHSKNEDTSKSEGFGENFVNPFKDYAAQHRRSHEIYQLTRSGKLEKTLRFFGLNGPTNIYRFAKMSHIAYSVGHGRMKRLERLGFVRVVSVVKTEKGVNAKLYGLSREGFIQATRFYKNSEELNTIIGNYSDLEEQKLLTKWDYIVGKVGEASALKLLRSSVDSEDSIARFVNTVFNYYTMYESYEEYIESVWVSLLIDDEQFREATLSQMEATMHMIKQDIARLHEQEEFCRKMRDIFEKAQQRQ